MHIPPSQSHHQIFCKKVHTFLSILALKIYHLRPTWCILKTAGKRW
nr:MAG TPA: hypothetical protein [Caudoviricetes sp.]